MSEMITIVLGTRPDAIKLAPLIRAFDRGGVRHRVVSTGQHRDLLTPILELFEIEIDRDLELMRDSQKLDRLHSAVLAGVSDDLERHPPGLVVVQGDTTTAFASALAAFYADIPIAHIEAGLRTRNLAGPWPEEFNRQAIARMASLHFAPTPQAVRHLEEESVSGAIHLVGNTVVDALTAVLERVEASGKPALPVGERPFVLVTCHRREQASDRFVGAVSAIRQAANARPDLDFLYPVHPNPIVRGAVEAGLVSVDNVVACPALPYDVFVSAMQRAVAVLTDSGGVQEEAAALGKPVLVMREESDRQETLDVGAARLVGVDPDAIVAALDDLPSGRATGLYGDGQTAKRIADVIASWRATSEE